MTITNPQVRCGPLVQTTCCENPIPESLIATIVDPNDCTGLDGQEFPLTYQGQSVWQVQDIECSAGTKWDIESLSCVTSPGSADDFEIEFATLDCDIEGTNAGGTCDPFVITFDVTIEVRSSEFECCNTTLGNPCDMQIVITE